MTTLADVEQCIAACGIEIIPRQLPCDLKALYLKAPSAQPVIIIDPRQTRAQRKARLAEELGHHHTSPPGHALTPGHRTRKVEAAARRWAFKYVVSFTSIIEAWDAGARTLEEMAEALEVSDDFLIEALQHYQDTYGDHAICGDVMISFSPVCVTR